MLEYTLDNYINAPGGEGPLKYQWKDKPHRLVYDLVIELKELQSKRLTRESLKQLYTQAEELSKSKDAHTLPVKLAAFKLGLIARELEIEIIKEEIGTYNENHKSVPKL